MALKKQSQLLRKRPQSSTQPTIQDIREEIESLLRTNSFGLCQEESSFKLLICKERLPLIAQALGVEAIGSHQQPTIIGSVKVFDTGNVIHLFTDDHQDLRRVIKEASGVIPSSDSK